MKEEGWEYADGIRRLPGITRARLKLLKHATCADCSQRATCLTSGAYLCDLCSRIRQQKAWREGLRHR